MIFEVHKLYQGIILYTNEKRELLLSNFGFFYNKSRGILLSPALVKSFFSEKYRTGKSCITRSYYFCSRVPTKVLKVTLYVPTATALTGISTFPAANVISRLFSASAPVTVTPAGTSNLAYPFSA